jgi:hypothetical protein
LLDVTGGAELSQDINATGGGEQPQGGQAVAAGSDATPQHYDNSRLEKLQNEILELGKLLKVVAEEQQAKRPKTPPPPPPQDEAASLLAEIKALVLPLATAAASNNNTGTHMQMLTDQQPMIQQLAPLGMQHMSQESMVARATWQAATVYQQSLQRQRQQQNQQNLDNNPFGWNM